MTAWRRAARLADIADAYGVFLVDQFGTLHDGARAYPGAAEALRGLRAGGARVAVLSNSGRRAAANAERLARLGIPPDCYDLVLTSGELGWHLLAERRIEAAADAATCLLIARGGDRSPIDGLGLRPVERAEEADLVILAGSEGERFPMAHYQALLAPAARRDVPCLCLNPDRTMLVGDTRAFGAGRIAETYAALGGPVTWIGKPHPTIYRHVLAALPTPRRAGVLGIGDSMEHDVAGARAAGCDAALVLTGLAEGADDAALQALSAQFGGAPTVVVDHL